MFLLKKLFKMRDSSHSDAVKPFLDHLEELRWTLLKMIITLVTTMLFAFGFRKSIAALLSHPLVAVVGDIQSALITTSPIESVTMSFTLSFYTGIVVAFPVLFYFLAEFILPALTLKEKRYVLPSVGVGFGLFLGGVVICYLYVLPTTLRWLHEDASAFARPSWTIREYYGFVTHLMIAVGLLCELPVVMVTLGAIGIISYEWMKGTRLYGYAGALILAGLISPTPDIFMLVVFALPIAALYELSIWLVWLMERRRARKEAKAQVDPNEPID